MSHIDLDDLDQKILKSLSRKRRMTADDIYSMISGFHHGKFGRSLVYLRLKKLAELNLLEEFTSGSEGQENVYSKR